MTGTYVCVPCHATDAVQNQGAGNQRYLLPRVHDAQKLSVQLIPCSPANDCGVISIKARSEDSLSESLLRGSDPDPMAGYLKPTIPSAPGDEKDCEVEEVA